MNITSENLKETIKQAIQETKNKEPKATLTIQECVNYTGIGRDKLMELVHSKNSDFPYFKVGSKFLVNRAMLNNWLEKISNEGRVL